MLSVALLEESREDEGGEKATPIPKEGGDRMYTVVTRLYMAQGFDGYDAFKGCNYLVDEDNGRIMSDLVRHFLLGNYSFDK